MCHWAKPAIRLRLHPSHFRTHSPGKNCFLINGQSRLTKDMKFCLKGLCDLRPDVLVKMNFGILRRKVLQVAGIGPCL